MSFFKPKRVSFEAYLSSVLVAFEAPKNFSHDFGYPQEFKSTVNIFDPETFKSSNLFLIYDLFWDYRSGLLLSDLSGTLGMIVYVEKLTHPIQKMEGLQKAVLENFNERNDKERRETFNIVDPFDLKRLNTSSLEWLSYKHVIGESEPLVYVTPISDQHLLHISFKFMIGSNEDKFLKQSNLKMQEIVESFTIKESLFARLES